MLNILWVEDNFTDEKQSAWFQSRKVDVKTDFTKAKEAINSSLEQFDLIVLDINLENSEHSNEVKKFANKFGITEQEFLEESGMNLFLQLLEHGFPKEQIIFLTANSDINISRVDELRESFEQENYDVSDKILESIRNQVSEETVKKCEELLDKGDNEGLCQHLESYFSDLTGNNHNSPTYNRFREAYRRCRIEPPKAINIKLNNEGNLHFNNWLENHEENNYLLLRRGIIEGCNFLKRHILENDANFQFRGYIKNEPETKEPIIEIETIEIMNYLDSLSQFLPIKQPSASENLNVQYRLFLRALVHIWEENILSYNKNNPEYINTFAKLSKITRNWTSHANLLEPLDTQIVAFLFLVNMRAMFKLKDVEAYEKTLFSCFPEPKKIDKKELSKCIKGADKHVNQILFELGLSEFQEDKLGKPICYGDGNQKKKFFDQKVNDIYKFKTGKLNKEEFNFKKFLLQYPWINQKNFIGLTSSSSGFLPVLARHIYKSSFENISS